MRVETRKVYRCDFCPKYGLRPIERHERGCTANPDRECSWHCNDYLRGRSHMPSGALRPHLAWARRFKTFHENEAAVDKLRRRVDGCPGCMLAVIRQARTDDDRTRIPFDFDAERERFNKELWDEAQRDEMREIEMSWL